MVKKALKALFLVLIISFLGFFGLIFYFADLGPGETWVTRNLIAFSYFFVVSGVCALISYPNKILPALTVWMVYLAAFLNVPGALLRGESSLVEILIMLIVPGSAVLCSVFVVKYIKDIYCKRRRTDN